MSNDIRVLKAKCRKCGKCFLFEMRGDGKEYKATNMEEAAPERYAGISSSVKPGTYVTNSSLQKDMADGRRIIGGYSYPKTMNLCKINSPYFYHCTYCNELEFDFTRVKNSPYGAWAGVSNIPDVALDEHGNPIGSDFDLAQDGAFKGYKVIICNFAVLTRKDAKLEKVTKELLKKGFEVVELRKNASLESNLADVIKGQNAQKTQIWILSTTSEVFSTKTYNLLKRYYDEGHGLYVLGDDEPCFADANHILRRLFPGVKMSGDYPGKKLLKVTSDMAKPGIIVNHPVTTGIVNFYEGTTVAGIDMPGNSILSPLIRGSNMEILAAYSGEEGKRLIADGGYTRLYAGWEQAGNERYFSNVAAYLANVERFGYDPAD